MTVIHVDGDKLHEAFDKLGLAAGKMFPKAPGTYDPDDPFWLLTQADRLIQEAAGWGGSPAIDPCRA